MANVRIPLAENNETRDGTNTKDQLMVNCYAEKAGNAIYVNKRFGTSSLYQLPAGTGLGAFTLLGVDYFIINVAGVDTLYNSSGTSFALTPQPSTPNKAYQVTISNDGTKAFLKTDYTAYNFNGTTVTHMAAPGNLSGITITNAGSGGIPKLSYSFNATTATTLSNTTFTPRAIAYGISSGGGNIYVAVGDSGSNTTYYATSVDGLTWTARALPTAGKYYGIAYGNGIFVIIGYGTSTSYTSSDGINWTTNASALPSAQNWTQIAYGNGIFVAVCGQQTFATSTDGVSWTGRIMSNQLYISYYGYLATIAPTTITYANSQFIMAGSQNAPGTTAYTDGTNTAYLTVAANRWYYSFCNFATSPDGINWSNESLAGSIFYTGTGTNTYMPYYNPKTNFSWNEIAGSNYAGGSYVAHISGTNTIATSSDGINWTANTLPSTATWTLYNNGVMYLIASTTGLAYYSVNGINWTAVTIAPSGVWTAIGSNGSVFVLLDNSATINRVVSNTPTVVSNAYNLSFTGGNGTGASGTYTIGLNGTVTDATITGGTGYTTSVPNVQFPGGGVKNAAATVEVSAYPTQTVPGCAYLDGTYYVLDINNNIVGSDLENSTSFQSLNTIKANSFVGTPKAIVRYLNYVVALKSQSTEVFYDVPNPVPASPLGTVPTALSRIGCADGRTVVSIDNTIFWVSQSTEKGYQVVRMDGFTPKPISTPDIERVINISGAFSGNVYSYGMKKSGHNYYVLTLVNSNVTVAYDITTGLWVNWNFLSPNATKSATLSYANMIVTAVVTAHGYKDGDVVTISGAAQSQYNGTFVINYIDANTFSYLPATAPSVTPATGTILANNYAEKYFPMSAYLNDSTYDLLLHESNGNIYNADDTIYQDQGKATTSLVMSWNAPATSAINSSWLVKSIAWNGSVYCAVGTANGTATTTCYTSQDGITWTARTIPSSIWYGIDWNGSVFCATGTGTVAATSPDGITWTARTLPVNAINGWRSIVYGNGLFVAVGATTNLAAYCATSPDGITWTQRSLATAMCPLSVNYSGAMFIIVGADTSSVTNPTTIAYSSPDGITWTQRTIPSGVWVSSAWDGSIFCSLAGTVPTTVGATSPDGITWTARTLPASLSWTSIKSLNNIFVIVASGSNNTYISNDGITWTLILISGGTGTWSALGSNGTNLVTIDQSATALITQSVGPSLVTTYSTLSPVEVKVRTNKHDGGNSNRKQVASIELIGDKVSSTAFIRYSDDDYQTYSNYRPVNMAIQRSMITRCGTTLRRAFELKHIDNTKFRVECLQLDVDE